jgi:hypothetical protein
LRHDRRQRRLRPVHEGRGRVQGLLCLRRDARTGRNILN